MNSEQRTVNSREGKNKAKVKVEVVAGWEFRVDLSAAALVKAGRDKKHALPQSKRNLALISSKDQRRALGYSRGKLLNPSPVRDKQHDADHDEHAVDDNGPI